MEKTKGLYQKYEVKKISNPDKKIDCIVLEWDDPNSIEAIRIYALTVYRKGFVSLANDLLHRIDVIEAKYKNPTSEGR